MMHGQKNIILLVIVLWDDCQLATVPRDLQATSPNGISQLVAPGTHTTGPKNHAAKHRLRTQKYHK